MRNIYSKGLINTPVIHYTNNEYELIQVFLESTQT